MAQLIKAFSLKKLIFISLIFFIISCEPRENENDEEDITATEKIIADSIIANSIIKKAEDIVPQIVPQMTPSAMKKKAFVAKEVNPDFPYQINNPDKTFKLGNKLQEISGLSMAPNSMQIVAVNDEKGELFFLDKNTGDKVFSADFGKNNDYEGVEVVGDDVFVIESSGKLHRVQHVNTYQQDTDKFDNKLSKKYNVEGLAYDASANQLLIACKGKAGKGEGYQKMRAIYSFDLKTKKYSKSPVYLISQKEIETYLDKRPEESNLSKTLRALLIPDSAADAFAPSGIAIHPQSRNLYILSTVGKLMVILSPNGNIIHIEALNRQIHRQPEGICFDKDGTLYIANEGKGKRGRIHKFAQQ